MALRVFNISILLGWLLVTIGGMILNVGAGLLISGILLLFLTAALSRLAGLFAAPERPE